MGNARHPHLLEPIRTISIRGSERLLDHFSGPLESMSLPEPTV
jgi:hypothetical protein